ncbi:MAG: sporulation initiation factor Spo0A C-terminal domain-containing protein [Clostridia bacterium]|nr:sporulation initiation factor Spo0A C-terminal domain-containing protein [Clostridia bacterium]
MEKITIIVVDQNEEFFLYLKNSIKVFRDMEIVLWAKDGKKAIDEIICFKPDIVILDSVLTTYDGIAIIEYFQYNRSYKPISICLSSIYNEKIKSMYINRGATYFLEKYYDIGELRKILKNLCQDIYNKKDSRKANYEKEKIELLKHISMILLKLGFNARLKGYNFLREIILIKLKNREMKQVQLYREVGKIFKIAPSSVSSTIRNSIKNTYQKNKDSFFYNICYNQNTYPNNEEFINIILEEMIVYYDI